jgi:hypothetical protein
MTEKPPIGPSVALRFGIVVLRLKVYPELTVKNLNRTYCASAVISGKNLSAHVITARFGKSNS